MTDTMIDRVRSEILAILPGEDDAKPQLARDIAVIVLNTIRNQTPAMVSAGQETGVGLSIKDQNFVYQAIIDEALK